MLGFGGCGELFEHPALADPSDGTAAREAIKRREAPGEDHRGVEQGVEDEGAEADARRAGRDPGEGLDRVVDDLVGVRELVLAVDRAQ